jgi:hypothetical protein
MPALNPETRAEANVRYYNGHRDVIRQRQLDNRGKLRKIVIAFKSVSCADCHVKYPYFVMDFHHEDGKGENISNMVARNVSVITLLSEIFKCIVLCANCHRIRSYSHLL